VTLSAGVGEPDNELRDRRQERTAFWTIMFLAGFVYAAQARREIVGRFIDDARFILRAQSLAQGRYEKLEDPARPPTNLPSPGYPLLLTPAVKVLGAAAPRVLPWFSALVSLGAVAAFWHFLSFWSWKRRTAAVALFALNPLIVHQAAAVLPEVGLTGLVLLLLSRMPPQTMVAAAGLALLAGWAFLWRAEAIVIWPALFLPFVFRANRRALVLCAFGSVGLWAGVLLRNHWRTQAASDYASLWTMSISRGEDAWAFIGHARRIGQGVLLETMAGLAPAWTAMASPAWIAFLTAAGLALAVWAGFLIWRKHENMPPRVAGLALFSFAYLAVHGLWLQYASHHYVLLVPALAMLVVAGAAAALGSARGLSFCALLTALYVVSSAQGFSVPPRPLLRQTFAWIHAHLPADAVIFSAESQVVTLYTSRPSVYAEVAGGPDALRHSLLRKGVTHVLLSGVSYVTFAPELETVTYNAGAWPRMGGWIARSPDVYREVFRQPDEQSTLYEVLPAPHFMRAYALFERGMQALRAGDAVEGSRRLDEALQIDPKMPSALNARGTAWMLEGKLDHAKKALDQAAVLRPWDPLIRLNRARLRRQMGDFSGARAEYTEAISLLERPGESKALKRVAESEIQGLPAS
jgi:hypothetical protein